MSVLLSRSSKWCQGVFLVLESLCRHNLFDESFFPYFTTLRELCRNNPISWHSILKSQKIYYILTRSHTFLSLNEWWLKYALFILYDWRLYCDWLCGIIRRRRQLPQDNDDLMFPGVLQNLHLGILYFVNVVQCDGFVK